MKRELQLKVCNVGRGGLSGTISGKLNLLVRVEKEGWQERGLIKSGKSEMDMFGLLMEFM